MKSLYNFYFVSNDEGLQIRGVLTETDDDYIIMTNRKKYVIPKTSILYFTTEETQ